MYVSSFLLNNRLLLIIFCFVFSAHLIGQRISIGVFYGPSIGYNSVYGGIETHHDLFDISLHEDDLLQSITMLNDNNFSNNIEAINGSVFGIRFNFPIIKGISIQPEFEYQKLDFNHILYQNGSLVIFNNLELALSGLQEENQYKIANYFWRVNYLNFPFLLKLYPSQKLFFQIGFKFGFLLKAEESRVSASFNIETNEYNTHQVLLDERVVYEFFNSDSGIDSHGFDKNEWPFNWHTAILGGVGFETKSFYCSLRYNLGLSFFFKELDNKDDDFFELYNTAIDDNLYTNFDIVDPELNNNFKLRSVHLTIGFNISN